MKRNSIAWAFTPAAEVGLVALDLAAERAVQFALAGEAAADDLVDALGAVTVKAHDLSGATRGHFEREVLDDLVELAVRQLAVSD